MEDGERSESQRRRCDCRNSERDMRITQPIFASFEDGAREPLNLCHQHLEKGKDKEIDPILQEGMQSYQYLELSLESPMSDC